MAITPVDAIEQWTDLIAPFAGPLRLDAVAIGAAAADVVQSYPLMDQPIRRFGTFVRDDHLSGLGLDLQGSRVPHEREFRHPGGSSARIPVSGKPLDNPRHFAFSGATGSHGAGFDAVYALRPALGEGRLVL